MTQRVRAAGWSSSVMPAHRWRFSGCSRSSSGSALHPGSDLRPWSQPWQNTGGADNSLSSSERWVWYYRWTGTVLCLWRWWWNVVGGYMRVVTSLDSIRNILCKLTVKIIVMKTVVFVCKVGFSDWNGKYFPKVNQSSWVVWTKPRLAEKSWILVRIHGQQLSKSVPISKINGVKRKNKSICNLLRTGDERENEWFTGRTHQNWVSALKKPAWKLAATCKGNYFTLSKLDCTPE